MQWKVAGNERRDKKEEFKEDLFYDRLQEAISCDLFPSFYFSEKNETNKLEDILVHLFYKCVNKF